MTLKRKMNTRAAGKKNRKAKLNVEAHTLTSDEGLQLGQHHENLTQVKRLRKSDATINGRQRRRRISGSMKHRLVQLSPEVLCQAKKKPSSRTLHMPAMF
jgi:hypothetical protein